jgi:hypothetical protein
MSMHKIPLAALEEDGLRKHGLRVGEPSQLSDCFRLGMAWAAKSTDAELAALRAKVEELKAENFKLAAGQCLCVVGDEGGNAYCEMKKRAEEAERNALERAAKVCDEADKSTHPAELADAIRALMKEGGE